MSVSSVPLPTDLPVELRGASEVLFKGNLNLWSLVDGRWLLNKRIILLKPSTLLVVSTEGNHYLTHFPVKGKILAGDEVVVEPSSLVVPKRLKLLGNVLPPSNAKFPSVKSFQIYCPNEYILTLQCDSISQMHRWLVELSRVCEREGTRQRGGGGDNDVDAPPTQKKTSPVLSSRRSILNRETSYDRLLMATTNSDAPSSSPSPETKQADRSNTEDKHKLRSLATFAYQLHVRLSDLVEITDTFYRTIRDHDAKMVQMLAHASSRKALRDDLGRLLNDATPLLRSQEWSPYELLLLSGSSKTKNSGGDDVSSSSSSSTAWAASPAPLSGNSSKLERILGVSSSQFSGRSAASGASSGAADSVSGEAPRATTYHSGTNTRSRSLSIGDAMDSQRQIQQASGDGLVAASSSGTVGQNRRSGAPATSIPGSNKRRTSSYSPRNSWGFKTHGTDDPGSQANMLVPTSSNESNGSDNVEFGTYTASNYFDGAIYHLRLGADTVQLFDRLGGGTQGEVNRGTCLGFTIAVKTITTMFLKANEREQLKADLCVFESLQHPHVVRHLGHDFVSSERVSVYMEFYSSNLRSLLDAKVSQRPQIKKSVASMPDEPWAAVRSPRVLAQWSPFSCFESFGLLCQIADGLHYIHSFEIIHRDLKAENIFCNQAVSADGHVSYTLLIGDFDTAVVSNKKSSKLALNVGSAPWSAPEVFSEGKFAETPRARYTNRVDSYSFGMVIFEVLTGEIPYDNVCSRFDIPEVARQGKRPQLNDLPVTFIPLAQLYTRCVDSSPSKRPSSREILKRLQRGLSDVSSLVVRNTVTADDVARNSSSRTVPSPLKQAEPVVDSLPKPQKSDKRRSRGNNDSDGKSGGDDVKASAAIDELDALRGGRSLDSVARAVHLMRSRQQSPVVPPWLNSSPERWSVSNKVNAASGSGRVTPAERPSQPPALPSDAPASKVASSGGRAPPRLKTIPSFNLADSSELNTSGSDQLKTSSDSLKSSKRDSSSSKSGRSDRKKNNKKTGRSDSSSSRRSSTADNKKVSSGLSGSSSTSQPLSKSSKKEKKKK